MMTRLVMAVVVVLCGASCTRSDVGQRCVMRNDTGAPLMQSSLPAGDLVTLNASDCDAKLCLLPGDAPTGNDTVVQGYCGAPCDAQNPCDDAATCRAANDGAGPTYCFIQFGRL